MAALAAAAALGALAGPAMAHHSFAMYDQTKTLVFTGVTTQFIGQANHAELHFYVIGSGYPSQTYETRTARLSLYLNRFSTSSCTASSLGLSQPFSSQVSQFCAQGRP